jgi:hypothetical protein
VHQGDPVTKIPVPIFHPDSGGKRPDFDALRHGRVAYHLLAGGRLRRLLLLIEQGLTSERRVNLVIRHEGLGPWMLPRYYCPNHRDTPLHPLVTRPLGIALSGLLPSRADEAQDYLADTPGDKQCGDDDERHSDQRRRSSFRGL